LKNKKKTRFSESINLALVSVALAFIVWIFARSGQTLEARITVPVVAINVDPHMEAQIDPPTMPVVVRYDKESSQYINSENFQFRVDVTDLKTNLGATWKVKSQPLSDKNWLANIAARVELVKIGQQNPTVEVRLRWNAVSAVVEPNIVGADRIPDGYQLVTPVKITPGEVYLVADQDVLNTLPRDDETSRIVLKTEPIGVAGRTQGSLESVEILMPPGVNLIQQTSNLAEVNIEIQEVQTVREIRGIKLDFQAVAPDTVKLGYDDHAATVTVFGPQSLIRQLTPDSFRMALVRPPEEIPGTSRDLPVEAHFSSAVSDDIRNRVTIRSIDPKSIKVNYTTADSQSTTTATTAK
jgi:hypothetical protein